MPFFRNRGATTDREPKRVPPLGPGRRLRSERPVAECVEVLEAVVEGYRPRRYPELPHVIPCGHTWLDDSPAPSRVVCCNDRGQDFYLIALWESRGGSELVACPLDIDVRERRLSLVDDWGNHDGSLLSAGIVPGGTVALRAPTVPDDYEREMLRIAGYPATARNVAAARDMMRQQFLLKAHQFIGSESPAKAQRFVDDHGTAEPQTIVTALGAWNPQVLPYIQDLPWRVRALMLAPEIMRRSPFWENLDR